jgi:hypothetical protein
VSSCERGGCTLAAEQGTEGVAIVRQLSGGHVALLPRRSDRGEHSDVTIVPIATQAAARCQFVITSAVRGHNVWGTLNAPAAGEALAELIADGVARSTDLTPFNPMRLKPLDPSLLRSS